VVTIYVDDEPYEVEAGQNLLHACLSHQLELPYFCWHPSLGSVGACRQCAVIHYRDETDKQGRLTMACMTPASDGTRISIAASEASEFRASVIEWLMQNHPHDCPVCEEGGECHLQDMTLITGHTVRKYRGQKRTFNNQYLGPFIAHEMNRCITCFRCVRFYHDYAGGEDLQVFGSRDRMYFGRANDGTLENAFSGNLVEVCPTGVFTDKPFGKTYTRKWDLQSAPSICPGCAVGCNVFPGERYGRLKRIHNRYHGAINGYFLCDRGRFGADFVNSERRLRQPGKRAADDLFDQLTPTDAVAAVTTLLTSGRVAGIGSPRASLETNTALQALVGEENFCNGLSRAEAQMSELALSIYRTRAARLPNVTDLEAADAIVILGEDVLNTAPRIALALRQSVRNTELAMAKIAGIPQWQDAGVRGHAQGAKNPLLIASIAATGLDDIASGRLHGSPEVIAAAGFNIANAINPRYPAAATAAAAAAEFVAAAVQALTTAQRPLIVAGFGTQDASVIKAAANVAWALRDNGSDAAMLLAPPEANTYGTAMLATGWDMQSLLEAAASGDIDTLIVAENDLFRRASGALVERALAGIKNLVVLDCLDTPTANRADIVLPAATFAESTGCFVNFETRAQRFYEVFPPAADIAPSWEWFSRIATSARRNDLDWQNVDDVLATCAEAPGMSAAIAVAPTASFRNTAGMRIPREPHRYSGRTAMTADVNIHEPKTRVDDQTPLSYSMEGLNRNQPGELIPYVWAPGWNSNQSVFKFQEEVGGALLGGNPGVRLINDIDPASSQHAPYSPAAATASATPAMAGAADGYRVLPLQHIFGSDELSMHSPAINERARDPVVLLHPDDAARLGVNAGDGVRCDEFEAAFEVRIEVAIAPGNVGMTLGFPGSGGGPPAESVSLRADPAFQRKRDMPLELIAKG